MLSYICIAPVTALGAAVLVISIAAVSPAGDSRERPMERDEGVLRGGMAEWSIAAVLKTAGLTAPGVRIPLPPPGSTVTLTWSRCFCLPFG